MSEREAERLKWIIKDEAPSLKPRVRCIGNGEHVVVVANGAMWLWSEDDWERRKDDPDILAKRLIA